MMDSAFAAFTEQLTKTSTQMRVACVAMQQLQNEPGRMMDQVSYSPTFLSFLYSVSTLFILALRCLLHHSL